MTGGGDLLGRTLLGKLRVLRRIGEGGMGSVYEVEHLLTKHRRALKILRAEVAPDARVVTRFVREAGVAGTVESPHIVQTFDAGTLDDGSPYVLMELLQGSSLADRLRSESTLPASEAAAIAIQICEGASAAHAAGIVHRDLKPDNVFLTRELVKILDFGISKFTAGDEAPLTTDTGAVIGTPFYMSPEQARGTEDVDARADVYAIGVMLYEMITGARPYEERAYAALVVKIHTGEHVPIAERLPSIDAELAAVIERAMHVDRDRRFDDARALAKALSPFARPNDLAMANTLPSVPAPAQRKRHPIWIAGLALATIGGAATIGALSLSFDGGEDTTRAEQPRPTAPEEAAPEVTVVAPPPVVPDGGNIAPPVKHPPTKRTRAERHGLSTGPLERSP